jgi:hypothetical protein
MSTDKPSLDEERGDEVLRRLLKTPPDNRAGKKKSQPSSTGTKKSAKPEQKGDG